MSDISKYKHVRVRNPAFDVTPHQYIDLICTEAGAISPEMSYLIIRERLGWRWPIRSEHRVNQEVGSR